MLHIGLTGGIASGKSAVARMFVSRGAALVDTDVVAREVVEPGSAGLSAVVAAFGESMLDTSGALDRARLRQQVFANAASRKRLEQILHPLIRERTLELMGAARGPYVIVAVPLLVETGFAALVERVLVIDCSVQTQLARLMQRDRMTEAEAQAAIAAQVDRQTRLAAADDVIDNDGSLVATERQVGVLHERYVAMSNDCRAKPGPAE